MQKPTKASSAARPEAQQVFRQFAWNLAGTLATAKKPATRGQTRRHTVRGTRKTAAK